MPTFSSLVATAAVKMTSNAASDENCIKMAFPFQCLRVISQLQKEMGVSNIYPDILQVFSAHPSFIHDDVTAWHTFRITHFLHRIGYRWIPSTKDPQCRALVFFVVGLHTRILNKWWSGRLNETAYVQVKLRLFHVYAYSSHRLKLVFH